MVEDSSPEKDSSAIKPLRLLMTSTSYPSDMQDWRGVFIRHLADALARRKDLRLTLWAPPGVTDERVELAATPSEQQWLAGLMERGGIAQVLRSGGWPALRDPLKLLRLLRNAYRRHRSVDLFHVNWLQSALPLLGLRGPALITVLGTDMKLLGLPGMPMLLRLILRGRRAAICPNAEWMVEPLRNHFADLATIEAVPFGIASGWYDIERRRAQDGIEDWLVVLRVTERKIGNLFSWGEALFSDGRRRLHLFGPMQEEVAIPDWVHYHGATHPQALMQEWFPRASGFITLSQHDEGRPQVLLEAMAAGLPIVASRLPAHSDLLNQGETGWLCVNREQFAEAVERLGNAAENHALGERARRWVAREIGTWDDCAERYHRLYRQLLKEAD